MDPANSESLQAALTALHQQEESLSVLKRLIKAMSEQQEGLINSVGEQILLLINQVQHMTLSAVNSGSTVTAVSTPIQDSPVSDASSIHGGQVPNPQLAAPEKFSGDSGDLFFLFFFLQCSIHFSF